MSAPYSCASFDESAAELGLGVLGGVERANALAHMERCGRCRAVAEELLAVGDALLGMAPEVEPPSGFESRLLARRESAKPSPRPGRRRRWRAGIAAVALAAGAAAGLALALPGSAGLRLEHPGAIRALGGRTLAATPLWRGTERIGQVFAYGGSPSWVFMTVDADMAPTPVRCELVLRGGATRAIGTFAVATGYRSWGATVQVNPSTIAGVRLVTAAGTVLASATF